MHFLNINWSGVLTVLAWLVPHETAAVLVHALCTPYNYAPCHFIQSQGCVFSCTCHLHFWQNDWDLLRATYPGGGSCSGGGPVQHQAEADQSHQWAEGGGCQGNQSAGQPGVIPFHSHVPHPWDRGHGRKGQEGGGFSCLNCQSRIIIVTYSFIHVLFFFRLEHVTHYIEENKTLSKQTSVRMHAQTHIFTHIQHMHTHTLLHTYALLHTTHIHTHTPHTQSIGYLNWWDFKSLETVHLRGGDSQSLCVTLPAFLPYLPLCLHVCQCHSLYMCLCLGISFSHLLFQQVASCFVWTTFWHCWYILFKLKWMNEWKFIYSA